MPRADRYEPVTFDPDETGRRWQREAAFIAAYAALENEFSVLRELLMDRLHAQMSDLDSGGPAGRAQ